MSWSESSSSSLSSSVTHARLQASTAADFGGVLGFSGEFCEVRDPNTLVVCSKSFRIRDSGGKWRELLDLFDRRDRDLEAVDSQIVSLRKVADSNTKLDASQNEWAHSVVGRAGGIAAQLLADEYDAALTKVDALLAQLS